MPRSGLILIALVPLLSWQVHADSLFNDSWYASPMFSYIDDDTDRNVGDSISGYHLGFGTDLNTTSSLEFSAIATFYDGTNGHNADQRQWGLGIDYIHRFGANKYFAPYAVVGSGLIKLQHEDPRQKDGTGLMTSFGVGALTPLRLYDMQLRTEMRLRTDSSNDSRRDFLFSVGLQRAFKPKPRVIIDSDEDGVADRLDLCRNTPRETVADRFGCAATQFQDRDANRTFEDGWYVSPMLSYIDDDNDRNVDDGLSGYSLAIGKNLNSKSAVEFSAVAAFYNADGFNADQHQWGFGADYVRRFRTGEYFVPYAVVGGGYIVKTQNTRPDLKDGSGLMASVGVGLLIPLDLFDTTLRTEFRLRNDQSINSRNDYFLSFGLQRSIRPRPVVIIDSDGDGVAEPQDRCGNTPPNIAVDRYGCAQTRDKDGDGVADRQDRCADTRPKTAVDRYGCAQTGDKDGDGVADENDMCNDSPRGFKVDKSGCRRTTTQKMISRETSVRFSALVPRPSL